MRYILATKSHDVLPSSEAHSELALFQDIDMSILASPRDGMYTPVNYDVGGTDDGDADETEPSDVAMP